MDEAKVQAIKDWHAPSKIKQAAKLDFTYEKMKQEVKEGATKKYWLEDDLLMAKRGHPSKEMTSTILSNYYY
ncbi:hypothetical protein CK203_114473 [Vitis vinifera]|uniref:Uncharacterized protein n=1 Tax=Vitis vinifera TaxID=29760 RepID=A0A438CDE4_VITVI|nr:hypothetical protein CK203_114473 [Vitis vinifera]